MQDQFKKHDNILNFSDPIGKEVCQFQLLPLKTAKPTGWLEKNKVTLASVALKHTHQKIILNKFCCFKIIQKSECLLNLLLNYETLTLCYITGS